MRSPLLLLTLVALGCSQTEPPPPTSKDLDPPKVEETVAEPTPEPEPEIEPDPVPVFPIEGTRSASGDMLVAPNSDLLMVADTETSAIHLVHPDWRRTFDAGGSVTRMVRVGDAIAVTLREEGEVAWFRLTQNNLVPGPRRAVGAEPFDVVASTESSKLYVSVSVDHLILELDASTLEETRRWEVAQEPRWLSVRPTANGEELFVTYAHGDALSRIDLASGSVHPLVLPSPARFTTDGCTDRRLVGRVTGEITFGIDAIYVPTLYVDPILDSGPNDEAVTSSCLSDSTDGTPGTRTPSVFSDGESADRLWQAGRFNAVVAAFDHYTLQPTLIDASSARTLFNSSPPTRAARTYPTSIVVEPESGRDRALYVALEGSDAIVRIDMGTEEHESTSFVSYDRTAFPTESESTLRADPDDPTRLWAWSWLDRTVRAYDREEMEALLILASNFGGFGFPLVPIPFTGPVLTLDTGWSALPEEVARGRDLFYSALSEGVASHHAGVSCATCHAGGRSDGITWSFTDRARQTPSLSGPLSLTAPFASDGEVATLEEMVAVSVGQMGGAGLTDEQLQDLATYIDHTRDILPPEDVDANQVALGAELFARADVGCASCHNGDRLTDNDTHAVLGQAPTQTPSLVGLAGTAPYLLDGSARTLRDVLDRTDGSMGDTTMLDETELDALEAYLRTR